MSVTTFALAAIIAAVVLIFIGLCMGGEDKTDIPEEDLNTVLHTVLTRCAEQRDVCVSMFINHQGISINVYPLVKEENEEKEKNDEN